MKPSWPLTRQKTLQSHRTHVWPMALSCLSEMRRGKAAGRSHTYSKTHFQSIRRVPDRSAVRFMDMVGCLLSDGGVWTDSDEGKPPTHTLSPLNIDAKSETQTRSSSTTQMQSRVAPYSSCYFCSMDTVCSEYVDGLRAVTCVHTSTETQKQHCVPAHVRSH